MLCLSSCSTPCWFQHGSQQFGDADVVVCGVCRLGCFFNLQVQEVSSKTVEDRRRRCWVLYRKFRQSSAWIAGVEWVVLAWGLDKDSFIVLKYRAVAYVTLWGGSFSYPRSVHYCTPNFPLIMPLLQQLYLVRSTLLSFNFIVSL